MKRSDWVLVLSYLPGSTNQENEAMDRIRIVKALFLLGKKLENLPNFYQFTPYLYGPFSLDIYRDIDELVKGGYMRQVLTIPMKWSRYSLTADGIKRAKSVALEIPLETVEMMKQIKALVQGFSFLELLRHVYGKYPEYAKHSVITLG